MDLKLIKNIIDLISKSDVNEVSIEEGEFKIKVKKAADVKEGTQVLYQSAPAQMQAPVAAAPTSTPVAASAPASEANNHEAIKSPMVGTFYKASSPESPDFVTVGQTISKGDPLCIIEAMKIMNEVVAEQSGTIMKVLVDNATPVEFDQPLFLIDPA